MLKHSLTMLAALAALATPAAARAADTTVASDPEAGQVTALGGTIVWVSGPDKSQVLMQRTAAGVARVKGAPKAGGYLSPDLGHDAKGKLVLTYFRCADKCKALRDDLRGHRSSVRGLTIPRCELSTPPALWGSRAAYGLQCHKGKFSDPKRSGLYLKTGKHAPVKLRIPPAAVGNTVESVDLRGTQVAAVAADIAAVAFTETVSGTRLHSFESSVSEGDTDQHTTGLALPSTRAMWTLKTSEHVDDPNQTVISRLVGTCRDAQTLTNPAGLPQQIFPATDLAVDGSKLYLSVQGTGIVQHTFVPNFSC